MKSGLALVPQTLTACSDQDAASRVLLELATITNIGWFENYSLSLKLHTFAHFTYIHTYTRTVKQLKASWCHVHF